MKWEHSQRYKRSADFLNVAESLIPLGSQTFSKSRTQYPPGIAPLFCTHSTGYLTYDLDGNEYVDLVSSLAAVTLGYGVPEINEAVTAQLSRGVTLSLATTLEFEVADLINSLVPCAEMVRFGKTGSDATAAAVRLARAYTGRDHILFCGYHGWQDWYIGKTSMNLGVPDVVSSLTHQFQFNDIESFRQLVGDLEGQVAAVILEPFAAFLPKVEFIQEIRQTTSDLGILLIFDETVTGFRVSKGGAQELLGVTPDLATFGKGIANGFPISAVTGKREYMKMFDQIFFSGTFGGECLSLVAAKVVLEKVGKGEVVEKIQEVGSQITESVSQEIESSQIKGLSLSGHDSWKFLIWDPAHFQDLNKAKTLFLQEMLLNGVLSLGSHNVTVAYDQNAVNRVVSAYKNSLSKLKSVEASQSYDIDLHGEPVQPLFKIR